MAKHRFEVLLANRGNPDFRQDPRKPLPDTPKDEWRPVATLKEASAAWMDYIAEHELGSGASAYGGWVRDATAKRPVAYVTYNGRVLSPDDHYFPKRKMPGDLPAQSDADRLMSAVAARLGRLADRWQDEREYEDFDAYVKIARSYLPQDFQFKSLTPKPFRLTASKGDVTYVVTATDFRVSLSYTRPATDAEKAKRRAAWEKKVLAQIVGKVVNVSEEFSGHPSATGTVVTVNFPDQLVRVRRATGKVVDVPFKHVRQFAKVAK